jgi:hypothetical protein
LERRARRKSYGVAVSASGPKISIFIVIKGKAIPLQALTGSEGFRRLRLPDFKTIGT